MFTTLIAELAHRSGGRRESGAFLLATATDDAADSGWVDVTAIAYYDDLDPGSLTGGITFHSSGYTALSALCRRDRVRVVGDIHTHPHRWVGQSSIDAANPMSALPGHIAFIAPRFAQGDVQVNDLGVHVHTGSCEWRSYYTEDVHTILRITGRTKFLRVRQWLRGFMRRARPRFVHEKAL
ncbi:hypothetical protein [Frankia sp. Cr1]|uniref:hypothetical protein n=1 Tax=Frankia sp. Cr1 TaxID=3073931 RepID=UPI002AD39A6A|nr:hypothetical protein [Frankia sp. Cr1]